MEQEHRMEWGFWLKLHPGVGVGEQLWSEEQERERVQIHL